MSPKAFKNELETQYRLQESQIAQFNEQGFIKLKDVFSIEVLEYYGKAITDFVIDNNDLSDVPMEERNTYQKAFIQVMNLWTKNETVRQFVFSKRLAMIAAELLGVAGVRLYHDQALYKEPSGGITPWHADQYYWPLASDRTVTAWIPLHAVPIPMGPLSFSAGSQDMEFGRDLQISDNSESEIANALETSQYRYVEEPFDLGEISFHLGWNYHKAGPNTTEEPRRIMTIIYMDKQMKLKAPENGNQQADWDTWCPGAKVGKQIKTPLNPVLYSKNGFLNWLSKN